LALITLPMLFYLASGPVGRVHTSGVIADLLRLLEVVPLTHRDYYDALFLSKFECEDALQFATCWRVNAKYLVTQNHFGHAKLRRWIAERRQRCCRFSGSKRAALANSHSRAASGVGKRLRLAGRPISSYYPDI